MNISLAQLRAQAAAQRNDLGFDYSPVNHDTLLALIDTAEAAMLLHATPFDAPDWTDRNLTLHDALDRFDFDNPT